MNICVFGAARDEIAPAYFALGEALGEELGRRGHTMIFGAGSHGMMGAAARGVSRAGGRLTGVVPTFFNKPGVLYEDCTELVYTETMGERKAIMEERADAFLALPGGIGTFEEIFEVITLNMLGQMRKRTAFLDVNGYWLPAVCMLENAVEQGFASPSLREEFGYFTDVRACLDYLEGK